MRIRIAVALLACLLAAPAAAHPAEPEGDGVRVAARLPYDPVRLLNELHPDAKKYVGALRIVAIGDARISTRSIYSGLVREGGVEPRDPEDAPQTGPGSRNDIVLFPSSFDPRRGEGWFRLILDHEYFHARHLAHGWGTPVVDFGDIVANRDYYEAVAWGYVLERARSGVYGRIGRADLREVEGIYRRHLEGLRRMISKRQPSAWAHYGRYLLEPDQGAGGGSRREAGLH